MPKSIFNGNGKTWLMLIGMLVAAAIAWGEIRAKSTSIENKVDKEVFYLHLKQSSQQFEEIKASLSALNLKMDKLRDEK